MLIVLVVFALVFLVRDLQVLSIASARAWVRFIGYALLITAGVAIFGWLSGGQPVWIGRRFALGALIIQIVELIVAWLLRLYSLGRYCWLGCILPAPAFLLAMYFIGWQLQAFLPGSGFFTAVAIVTGIWIGVVIALAAILYVLDDPLADRRFATDFAMMTGCTAMVFVPIWLS